MKSPNVRERLAANAFLAGFSFLLVAAALGFFLRIMALETFAGVNYRFILHAHSHTAFLAWVFNAILAFTVQHFAVDQHIPTLRKVFYLLQAANLGMLVAFPFQGYAIWSISFSTLHMAASFVFAWKLFRCNTMPRIGERYLRASLLFMAISSIGPLSLGPLAALDLRDSPWYTLSIYFYMHFQYNGWFVFFLLAAAVSLANSSPNLEKAFASAYPWLVIGCLLTLAQTAIWTGHSYLVNLASLLGSIAQLAGCGIILTRIRNLDLSLIAPNPKILTTLLRLALACLILKFVFQFAGSLPGLELLVSNRSAAIGFLHLVFLGVVTPALVAWGISNGWIHNSRFSAYAIALYLAAFLLSESVLFYAAGASLSNWSTFSQSPLILAIAAALNLLALACLLSQATRKPLPQFLASSS